MRFTQTDIATLATWFVQKGVTALATTFTNAVDIMWGGVTLMLGADNGLATRTDATSKFARVASAHYTNAEESVAMMLATNAATANTLFIGGGTAIHNSATTILLYTGATSTTNTGSRRMTIDEVGNVGIGGSPPVGRLDVNDTIGGVLTLRRQDASVTLDDTIGVLQFWAADTSTSTNFVVANIEAQAAATVTTDINPGRLIFRTTPATVGALPTERMRIAATGNIGIGAVTTPTARVHIAAGSATANTAPIKLTAGPVMTTAENGALEYDGTDLWFTVGTTRKKVTLV
jgi:hypothetical protein